MCQSTQWESKRLPHPMPAVLSPHGKAQHNGKPGNQQQPIDISKSRAGRLILLMPNSEPACPHRMVIANEYARKRKCGQDIRVTGQSCPVTRRGDSAGCIAAVSCDLLRNKK
ncbi:hypothetical protein Sant_0731 [Sodalis praecaptivus]|uniref:Uncharacterized protein n=1 Tax=Sodalis praecaptivus TaxID=1239307 RepID=W0HTF4_9GAMM|nr:hypothetical protein Sant_0731 [Sodalis praecaptivus]